MKRAMLIFLLSWMTVSMPTAQKKKYGFDPAKFPKILQEADFEKTTFLEKLYGFIGWDYSSKDMRQLSREFLALQAFDELTIWPASDMLPPGFAPDKWMSIGKEPGLNVRELHRQGIKGKGIAVAVFDKYINPEHAEFSGRIIFHKIKTPLAEDFQYRLHFHGMACASILCGSTLGIAPEATLHYFAVPDDARNSYNYCVALEELLKVNSQLPQGQKIRAVSISDAINRKDPEVYAKWQGLDEKAAEQGIAVIYSDGRTTHAVFTWGGCPPFLDRNNAENYEYAQWPRENDEKRSEKIILPADYRTTAQNRENDAYVYWGDGGFSWAIPYFTGLAALALSINADLTIEDIYRLIKATKTRTSKGHYVVNPVGFVESVNKISK